ncbi:MAG: extracellular solute-binding protein, partial [Chloroflexota bacterium]
KVWKDLLNSKYKGKIAADDPRTGGSATPIFSGLLLAYGEPFMRDLQKNDIFFSTQRGVLDTGLTRGEYGMLTTALNQYHQLARPGVPVKLIKFEDGVAVVPVYMYTFKGSPHPNGAKLWIDWALSEEGQKAVAEAGLVPVRKGITAKDPLDSLEGLKFLPRVDTPEMFALINDRNKKYEEIYFKK